MATFTSADRLPGRREAHEAEGRSTALPQQSESRSQSSTRQPGAGEFASFVAPDSETANRLTLSSLLRRHRLRLAVRYALIALENALRVIQPLVLGGAINDLLAGTYYGLMFFVGQHLGYVLVGSLRQMHETRFLRDITADATAQALDQAQQAQGPKERSPWIDRLVRIREAIDIEMDSAPQLIHIAFSFVGALLLLGWYDMTLIPLCLVLVVPAVLLTAAYGRKSLLVNRRLQAEHKRGPEWLASGAIADVRRHFETITHWRSELADAEATHFCLMELFVLGLLAAVLVHYCLNAAPRAGDVFAVFQYVLLFITALGGIPIAMQHAAQLLGRRS